MVPPEPSCVAIPWRKQVFSLILKFDDIESCEESLDDIESCEGPPRTSAVTVPSHRAKVVVETYTLNFTNFR